MTLGIELPNGEVITDAEWHDIGDVMRASHGFGKNRVAGTLVEVDYATQTVIKEVML